MWLALKFYLHSHGLFFFFNAPATPEIYTLSLHDALPIWKVGAGGGRTSCSWPDAWRPGSTPCNRVPRSRCSTKLSARSEEHTSELQSLAYIVCRLLLEKKKQATRHAYIKSF